MNDQSLPDFIIVEEPEDNNGRTLPGKTGFNFSDTKILSRVLRGIGHKKVQRQSSSHRNANQSMGLNDPVAR